MHWPPIAYDRGGDPTEPAEVQAHAELVALFLEHLKPEPGPNTDISSRVIKLLKRTFGAYVWKAWICLEDWVAHAPDDSGWARVNYERLITCAPDSTSGSPEEDLAELVEIVADQQTRARGFPEAFSAADLADKPLPERRWLLRDLIPEGEVTLVSGDGAVGKGVFILGLGTARALSRSYLGIPTAEGATFYVSSEDDQDELHIRLHEAARGEGVGLKQLGKLHLRSMVGKDLLLGVPSSRGRIVPTRVWFNILRTVLQLPVKPDTLVLENLADVFGGDENSRSEAKQFIRLLQTAALAFGLTVIVLAHPSQSGLMNGSGTAGTTGWNNAVRSRLLLERIVTKYGEEHDPDLRRLRLKKANRARHGQEILLRWHDGTFRLEDAQARSAENQEVETADDALFLSLLKSCTLDNRNVCAVPGTTYAPAVFAKLPDAAGVSSKRLGGAMERLLKRKSIKIAEFGPPSKPRKRLEIAA